MSKFLVQKSLIEDIENTLSNKMSYYVLMMFKKNSISRDIARYSKDRIIVSLNKDYLEYLKRTNTNKSKNYYYKVVKLDYNGLVEAMGNENNSEYILISLNKNKNGFIFIPKRIRKNRANMPRQKSNH